MISIFIYNIDNQTEYIYIIYINFRIFNIVVIIMYILKQKQKFHKIQSNLEVLPLI
jgi:hypothetical protein